MMRRARFILLLSLALSTASCTQTGRKAGDIAVIGDSVMVWNSRGGNDIGSVVAAELGREVVNRAALGAQVSVSSMASIIGLSIPAQLPPGGWNWVVANGAANDLGLSCGCTRCDDEIEALISPDGRSGAIPDLIAQAHSQGARVIWLGYYEAPETTSFQGCRPGLVEIERRIALLARDDDKTYFLDAEDILDSANRDLLDRDRTHPSVEGSDLIGKEIARMISEADQRS